MSWDITKTEGEGFEPSSELNAPKRFSRPRRLRRSPAVSSGFQRPQSATDRTGRGSQLQGEDKRESFVDGLLLVSSQPTSELAETVDVDCSKLLDEHACPLVGEVDLGSERSGCRASRRRRDDRRR